MLYKLHLRSQRTNRLQMYNLENDPYEKKNLVNDRNSSETLKDLKQWAMELVKEMVHARVILVGRDIFKM